MVECSRETSIAATHFFPQRAMAGLTAQQYFDALMSMSDQTFQAELPPVKSDGRSLLRASRQCMLVPISAGAFEKSAQKDGQDVEAERAAAAEDDAAHASDEVAVTERAEVAVTESDQVAVAEPA